jgi:hypothetical protein
VGQIGEPTKCNISCRNGAMYPLEVTPELQGENCQDLSVVLPTNKVR